MTPPPSESLESSARAALEAYVRAFEAGDADAIAKMMGDHAMVEIPMLKPSRLVGAGEIRKGHAAAFETLAEVAFSLTAPAESGCYAMAEGILRVTSRSGARETHHIGIVAETDAGALQRLSLYCDARNVRMWSDKKIM